MIFLYFVWCLSRKTFPNTKVSVWGFPKDKVLKRLVKKILWQRDFQRLYIMQLYNVLCEGFTGLFWFLLFIALFLACHATLGVCWGDMFCLVLTISQVVSAKFSLVPLSYQSWKPNACISTVAVYSCCWRSPFLLLNLLFLFVWFVDHARK